MRKKQNLLIFFLLIVFVFFVDSVQAKKPFTLFELYKLKSIGNLAISHNGDYLAFTLTTYNLKKSNKNSDIYLLNLKTSEIKRLTYNKKSDYSPFWSLDDKSIYFLSTREKEPKIFKINIDGGEAEKIMEFSPGISKPEFINNKLIVFTSSVYPECGANAKCNKKFSDKLSKGPVHAHYATSLLYRHWTFYRDWKYTHIITYNLKTKKFEDLTPGKHDFPPFSLSGDKGFAISPDKNELCVVSNFDKDLSRSTNNDLFLLNLKTKKLKCITCDNKAFDGHPKYSPNGKYIAYLMQKIPGYESDLFRLAIYNRKTGEKRIISKVIDNWIDDFVWSTDSKYIYFKVEEKGHYPLYKVNLKTNKIKKIVDLKALREFEITSDGKSIILTRTSVSEPVEIYRYRIGKKAVKLTSFNDKIVSKYDIRPAEEYWVKGAEGANIHVFIIKPHNFNPTKKYPLILNIHGGPQQMWADSFRGDWQIYPGAGYIVAYANPHGSPGYGQKFVEAISGDWGGKVMEDIEKVTDYLATLPYVDNKRMGAMGWSWGGYAIMWLEGHTDRFKAMVAMMGVYDLRSMHGATEELWFPEWEMKGAPWQNPELYKKFSPSNYVKNFKTPCLVITGERDYRVPYTQSLQFFTDLQSMNVPSALIIFKNDGHWPNYIKSMPVYYNAHLEWFHKYLGGGKAPFSTEKMIRNQIKYNHTSKKINK